MHIGNGGLQAHSIGDDYPWTVVGSIDEGGTIYYIANLVDNTRTINTFESSYVAHFFAKELAEARSALELVQWIKV